MAAEPAPHQQTTQERIAWWAGTWFGVGYSSLAPGTMAALTAPAIHWLLRPFPSAVEWSLIAALTVLGVWSSQKIASANHDDDPQIVVIDEVVGALIAMAIVSGQGTLAELAALVLFRGVDITKPWPIYLIERMKPAGVAIMLDDIAAAGVAGLIALWI